MSKQTYIITGGYGFIGSCIIRKLLNNKDNMVINIDKITYASNKNSIVEKNKSNYKFYKTDISDQKKVMSIIRKHNPDYVINLAAESHVDRSIDDPDIFIKSNIVGTFSILNASYKYWLDLKGRKRKKFRFLQVSTDEVFGSLKRRQKKFNEESLYKPNNPYSASKAASDHLVRSWFVTYNFPSLITNTTNNYGPWQFPEKLIPLVINKCINSEKIPIYGNGRQIRDWIYVNDHVDGILTVLKKGSLGEKYNISSDCELENIKVVKKICSIMQELIPNDKLKFSELITFVDDRPGHDVRYGLDNKKILRLGWKPKYNWEDGLRSTITWYLKNREFLKITKKNKLYSGERLGKIE